MRSLRDKGLRAEAVGVAALDVLGIEDHLTDYDFYKGVDSEMTQSLVSPMNRPSQAAGR
jgi:hypothetical protein